MDNRFNAFYSAVTSTWPSSRTTPEQLQAPWSILKNFDQTIVADAIRAEQMANIDATKPSFKSIIGRCHSSQPTRRNKHEIDISNYRRERVKMGQKHAAERSNEEIWQDKLLAETQAIILHPFTKLRLEDKDGQIARQAKSKREMLIRCELDYFNEIGETPPAYLTTDLPFDSQVGEGE